MRRFGLVLVALAAMALLAPAVGLGHGFRGDAQEIEDRGGDSLRVHGTVASVDTAANTITVTLNARRGPHPGGHGGPPRCASNSGGERCASNFGGERCASNYGGDVAEQGQQGQADQSGERPEAPCRPRPPSTVTVKTDADTGIYRNGQEATLADLAKGDKIDVSISSEDEDATRAELLATPAWLVIARTPPQAVTKPVYYGFSGPVTAVDTTAGTLRVNVRFATPNVRKLLVGVTDRNLLFTTNSSTRIVSGGGAQGLASIEVGEHVAVGIKAQKGATLDQVLAQPARVVIDLGSRANQARLSRAGLNAQTAARNRR